MPVAQTATSTPESAAANSETSSSAGATSTRERRREGERRRDGDRRGRGGYRPVRGTVPAPAGEAPVNPAPAEPAAPTEPGAPVATDSAAPTAPAAPGAIPAGGRNGDNNGLDVLGRDCTASKLPAHTGFQEADAQCVNTAMGEVAAEDKLPSLLITDAPRDRRGRPALPARGQHPQPGARPVPRRGCGRLLPGELVPQRRRPAARALPHRLPDPAVDDRGARLVGGTGVLPGHPGQRWRRGTGHGDDQRARRRRPIRRRAAVHVVGR